MAAKLGVAVDCKIKTIFASSLSSNIKTFMATKIAAAINKSSKLEVVDGAPDKGFSFTATLELTLDPKNTPPQIKAVIAIAILGSGLASVTINLKTPAQADAGSKPDKFPGPAKDVVDALLDNMLPKVVKAMEAKVP